jgi:hypothetical protein
MKELKTLKELLDEVGSFPFQATTVNLTIINVVGKGPGDKYIVWYQKTENIDLKVPDVDKCWTLVPKKKVLKSFVYQTNDGKFYPSLEYTDDIEHHCKQHNCKLIKILDEIEVEI